MTPCLTPFSIAMGSDRDAIELKSPFHPTELFEQPYKVLSTSYLTENSPKSNPIYGYGLGQIDKPASIQQYFSKLVLPLCKAHQVEA